MYPEIPPPPPPSAYPVVYAPPSPPKAAGTSIAALVLGICSLLFSWWGLATLAMVILAVTFGARGLSRPGRGMAIAGLVCGLAGGLAYLCIGIVTAGIGFVV